jgi:branched-subunit amino acid ABC-type transport system permease component
MLILGLMEQINLAHGSLFALGAYFAYAIATPRLPLPPDLLASWAAVPLGWRFTAAMFLAPVLVAPFGLSSSNGMMRRTYGRDPLYGLLLTFGMAMVLEELIRTVWGTRDYTLPVPRGISGGFLMLDLIWSTYRFWAAGFAIVAMAVVWVVIERTRFGALVKAGAHDSEMVQALGIDLEKLRVWVFVLGTMLAARRRGDPRARVGHPPAHGRRRRGALLRRSSCWAASAASGARCWPESWSAWSSASAGAYASEWSMMSMYLLLIAVVTFRARGLFGKKSVLEA